MTPPRQIFSVLIIFFILVGFISLDQAPQTALTIPAVKKTIPPSHPNSIGLANFKSFLPVLFHLESITSPPWLDTSNKAAVTLYYLIDYISSEGIDSQWTGNHDQCDPGTTAQAFQDAVLRRINYFRAMAGVPANISFLSEFNQKAQSAALMMSANNALSHDPPPSWNCYTADGDEAAGRSNLFLGVYGPDAISGYVYDPGASNYAVGHRRWILYPQTQHMGTGDIPPVSGKWQSNALWVIDLDNIWGPRPETRDGFVAWPPPGYVPRQVVYPRWSFAYPEADFSSTAVEITRGGQNIGLTISPILTGYGENTIVWELSEAIPEGESRYVIHLTDVSIDGQMESFNYEVNIFDPTD